MKKTLLKTLAEARGVPGQEGEVRDIVKKQMKGMVDSMEIDLMGNLIGVRKGKKGGPRVMIAAHMDEIGFVVKYIDDNGFLRLQTLGGFDPRQLFAQRVLVSGKDGTVHRGVLTYATKPKHLLGPEEMKAGPKLDNFFVDLGMTAEEARENIRIGAMATMDRTCEFIGSRVTSKCLDNRVSVFIMLEALRALGKTKTTAEIVAVATTQEEIGLRGAATSAFAVQPDIGIALDVTLALDHPGPGGGPLTITELGKGVGIKILDSSLLCHPLLVDHFREIAEREKIPHQMEILPRGGTDAGALQRAQSGIPAITLSTPCRYIHTVNETVESADIQATIDLLAAYLREAHKGNYRYK